MVGAPRPGATVFLAPADNCAEAARAIPDGLRLVRVATLHEAVQAVDTIRTGWFRAEWFGERRAGGAGLNTSNT